MSHPQTYTAYAFLHQHGALEKITVQWKDPQPGEIVVKVLACGVCGSDELVRESSRVYPIIPGHEIVGTVTAIPQTEKKWRIGQRVGSGWHGGHCGECDRCGEGDFITCPKEAINGLTRDGGYAEYVTLRSEATANVPEDIDFTKAAPLLCAGVTCFNSLRHMDIRPPQVVAVHGIGGLGHLGIQFARAMGYYTVALSSGASKEALSKELGAHLYVDSSKEDPAEALQRLGGASVIMCTAPNPVAIEALVSGLAIGGTLLVLAVCGNVSVPTFDFNVKRLSLRSWPAGGPLDDEAVIRFSQIHNIKIMVETFPLEKAQEAYDARASARFRAVIVP